MALANIEKQLQVLFDFHFTRNSHCLKYLFNIFKKSRNASNLLKHPRPISKNLKVKIGDSGKCSLLSNTDLSVFVLLLRRRKGYTVSPLCVCLSICLSVRPETCGWRVIFHSLPSILCICFILLHIMFVNNSLTFMFDDSILLHWKKCKNLITSLQPSNRVRQLSCTFTHVRPLQRNTLNCEKVCDVHVYRCCKNRGSEREKWRTLPFTRGVFKLNVEYAWYVGPRQGQIHVDVNGNLTDYYIMYISLVFQI